MQYPYVSIFPDGIDERTYFCDVDLKGQTVMDAYQKLIEAKQYTDANNFLSQQNKVHHLMGSTTLTSSTEGSGKPSTEAL